MVEKAFPSFFIYTLKDMVLYIMFFFRYWVLVLPPWGHLYHWQSEQLGHQAKIPWKTFFNTDSLGLYVPVIEFEEWLEVSQGEIGTVYYLQAFREGWESGKFEDKWEVRDCIKTPKYKLNKDSKFEGHFYFFGNKVFADRFACLSVQGSASVLAGLVKVGVADTSETVYDEFPAL